MDSEATKDPTGQLSSDEAFKVREALQERGAMTPCSRCSAPPTKLAVMPRLAYINLQTLAESVAGEVQEQSIPTAIVLCGNCGATYSHAIGTLGLMNLSQERGDG